MGITAFMGWLLRRYKGALVEGIPDHVAELLIDMNGFYYGAAAKSFSAGAPVYKFEPTEDGKFEVVLDVPADREIYQKTKSLSLNVLEEKFEVSLEETLLNVLKRIQPTKRICLFFDGPAPFAKALQQRKRRFNASLLRTSVREKLFDTNVFTPGTIGITSAENFFRKLLTKKSFQQKIFTPQILFSSWKSAGEGEHKLMDLLRYERIVEGGAHVFYGMDTDLVLLCLTLNIEGIYLWRDTPTGKTQILSIDILISLLLKDLRKEKEGEESKAIQDFILMTLLFGNDFLPRYPFLTDAEEYFSNAFETYKKIPGSLVGNEGKINWKNLFLFFQGLREREMEWVSSFAKAKLVFPLSPFEKSIKRRAFDEFKFEEEKFQKYWYEKVFHIDMAREGIRKFQKVHPDFEIPDLEISPSDRQEMMENYLRTFQWNMFYYLKGTNFIDFHHAYRYSYTPLLSDLLDFLNVRISNGSESELSFFSQNPPFTPYEQLLCVLPFSSVGLCPSELQPYFSHSSLQHLYPIKFHLDFEGKLYSYEAIPILPIPDLKIIQQVLSKMEENKRFEFPNRLFETFDVKNAAVYDKKWNEKRIQNIREKIETKKQDSREISSPNFRGRGRGGRGESRGEYRGRGGRGESRGRGGRGEYRGRGGRGESRGEYRGRGTSEIRFTEEDLL